MVDHSNSFVVELMVSKLLFGAWLCLCVATSCVAGVPTEARRQESVAPSRGLASAPSSTRLLVSAYPSTVSLVPVAPGSPGTVNTTVCARLTAPPQGDWLSAATVSIVFNVSVRLPPSVVPRFASGMAASFEATGTLSTWSKVTVASADVAALFSAAKVANASSSQVFCTSISPLRVSTSSDSPVNQTIALHVPRPSVFVSDSTVEVQATDDSQTSTLLVVPSTSDTGTCSHAV